LKTKPTRNFDFIAIIISLVALGVSIYSAILSSESHHINKTQTLVGKRFEILSLMKQLIDLKNREYDLVQKIIWTYQGNRKVLDEEKDRYSYWKEEKDKIRDEINKEQEIQKKFMNDKKDNTIDILENYVGFYKVAVSYAVSSNDHAKKFLDELEKKLLKGGLDNQNNAKETNQKIQGTVDSTR
jgi:hypothetical protein